MPDMSLFVPITKIDVEKRLVYGIATAEQEDRSGEIMDYDTTKPFYEKWSSDFSKASGGKSLGNVRAMHGKIAAGKLTAINFDDVAKRIEVCAKVVDDAEWQKVEEGVYTGFSQGGAYVKRWKDNDGLQRYTASPNEISLVDLPCLPSATFEVIKASGSETRHFQTPEKEIAVTISNETVAAKARELAKAAGDESKWADHIDTARADLEKAAADQVVDPAPVVEPTIEKADTQEVPVTVAEVEQVWLAKDGTTFKLKADAVKRNEELAKSGNAVDDALNALGKAMNGDVEPIKPIAPTAVAKFKTKPETVEKGLYSVGRLASLILELDWLQEDVEWEAAYEEDGSTLPDEIKASVAALCVILRNMVAEETAEMVGGDDVEVMEMAFSPNHADALAKLAAIDGLDEAKAATLAKLSEKRSTAKNEPGDADADKLVKADGLAKLEAENAELKSSMEKAVKGITDAAEMIKTLKAGHDEMAKRLETIEAQPMPGGPGRLNIVGKDGDSATAEVPDMAKGLLQAMSSGDNDKIATELFKLSQANGKRTLPGIGQVTNNQAPETE